MLYIAKKQSADLTVSKDTPNSATAPMRRQRAMANVLETR
jgi:hypothetical protein